ncbi:MAG: glycosyltransferase family 2 protein [Candidatus Bathyarchaeota archaeon]|nr:MAG: glycosyltransferase family 2 protein [Candidatus Bathyarchaeota archaeon]
MIKNGRKQRMGMRDASEAKMAKWMKLQPILFGVPFILAYLVWRWFPILAEQAIIHGFDHIPTLQPTHWLWYATTWFFYFWYTFLSIVIGGSLLVAAWVWKWRQTKEEMKNYPPISFIIPAYNEEKTISKCIASLFRCAIRYPNRAEIIVVDDGSTDSTHEVAQTTIKINQKIWSYIRGEVIKHESNLGKASAIRAGVNKATGEVTAIVDADSWWEPTAINHLATFMNSDAKAAVTGYIHPSGGNSERNLCIILQQLEYSQGLGVFRCAQALGNAVLVVPGPIGMYNTEILREVFSDKKMQSITEDFEITLELQKRGFRVGYLDKARSVTIAPTSFRTFWNQRLRWFTGGLHNILCIHRNLLFSKRWLSLLLWYCLITGYGGAAIELTAVLGIPILYWFAPDRVFFLYNLLMFLPLMFTVGIIQQAIALKFAYNHYNHKRLLLYTPLYSILRFINVFARFNSMIKYILGRKGIWEKTKHTMPRR